MSEWTIERVMDDSEGARLRIEELEQEITDGALSHAEQVNGLAERIEKLEAENEQLAWYYENMRLADRYNLEMQYEYEHEDREEQPEH